MAEVCLSSGEDCGEEEIMDLDKDLERMIEDAENISVQQTWLAYDMVVQRTSPDLTDSLRALKDAYLRCKAVMQPNQEQQKSQGQTLETGQGKWLGPQMEEERPAGPTGPDGATPQTEI